MALRLSASVGVLCSTLLTCKAWRPIAPEDASLRVQASRDTILVEGDTSTVQVVLTLADGSLAGEKWDIDIILSQGLLETGRTAGRYRTDANGEVTVRVRSGAAKGAIVVTARSGGASAADTIVVTAKPSPT